MKEETMKHLELIQNIINRHNSNSFMIKGWAMTIVSALLALAGTVKEPYIMLIALIPILLFWGLDAFFLSNERCFVDLYNAVVEGKYEIPTKKILKEKFKFNIENDEAGTIPEFVMNFKKFKIWKNNKWHFVLISQSIFWFYFSMSVTSIVMLFVFLNLKGDDSKILDVNATLKSNGFEIKINSEPPKIINNIYTISKDSLNANKQYSIGK